MSELKTLEQVKREHVLAVLAACGGNQARAAAVLGVSRRALGMWLKAWRARGLIDAARCATGKGVAA